MSEKPYKVIKRNENCVLLQHTKSNRYKVRDIENDDICVTYDKEHAERIFNEYDIQKIREEKEKGFEAWLKEFTEA